MFTDDLRTLLGNTPLLCIRENGSEILCKLEGKNPGGSIKDRAALYILREAERDGRLAPGGTVVEATSGNTGVGLAMLGSALGYHAVIVMPDTMSEERRRLMTAFGAELVLTDGALGMAGAIEKAAELALERGGFEAKQFENPAVWHCHYETTGPELLRDAGVRLDAFAAAVGTGGTFTGTAKYLKEQLPGLRAVAVEPAGSPVLSGGKAGRHAIQGIGAGFVPKNYDPSLADEILTVTDDEAYDAMRELACRHGILCGISSGAAFAAARRLAARRAGLRVACILPDTGERYLSILK